MGKLHGKVAIVTGASRGLGHAITAAYLHEGAKVGVISRTEAIFPDFKPSFLEERLIAIRGDLSSPSDIDKLFHEVHAQFGPVDVLVNNAAILEKMCEIKDFDLSLWNQTIAINLTAVFLCIQSALQHMIPRKQGSIINVSSNIASSPRPSWGAYAISKAGVECMTKLVAEEVHPFGIRVNLVMPRRLNTAMRKIAHPEEDPASLLSPAEVASCFVYLASDESASISGNVFDLETCSKNAWGDLIKKIV